MRLPIRNSGVLAALAIAFVAGTHPTAAAPITLTNPGFESGDTSGWTETRSGGAIQVLGNDPAEGAFYAALIAGVEDQYVTVSQSFSALAGDTLSFAARFIVADSFDDDAFVSVFDASNVETSLYTASVSNPGSGQWVSVDYTFIAGGSYTLVAGVRNFQDDALSSVLAFDTRRERVPEPATLGLLGLGLAYAVTRRRRQV